MKGSIFHVASALTQDCEIPCEMDDLAFDRATMETFVEIHVRAVPRTQNPTMVELHDVFFGQSINRFVNVSGLSLTNRR